MDDFTRPSVRYLTLSVFWVSLLGIPKSLVIWVRGYPKHGDTQITVTAFSPETGPRICISLCPVLRERFTSGLIDFHIIFIRQPIRISLKSQKRP